MADRVEWGRPRRLNAVTVTLILAALAFSYWLWRFFPAYFNAWTVDHILLESASEVYRANHLAEPLRTNTLRQIVDKARADIVKQAGVTDPDLTVNVTVEPKTAIMSADYHVVVTHPFTPRTTTLHFERREKADIQRVNWDN